MAIIKQEFLARCVYRVLLPVARFCIRNSFKLPEAYEIFKSAYVNAAKESLKSKSETISQSRINVMTGVHRADIARIDNEGQTKKNVDYATRVITQWQHNKRYCTNSGKPRTLDATGKNSEFVDLVLSVSKDLNPYTILFELERTGIIKRTSQGVKLVMREYVPSKNLEEGFSLLENDLNELILTVEENLIESDDTLNHHLTTGFDKIPSEDLPKVKKWLMREGAKFHDKIRKFLIKHDADYNQNSANSGNFGKISFTSFSRLKKHE